MASFFAGRSLSSFCYGIVYKILIYVSVVCVYSDSVTQETPPTYRNVTIRRGSDGFGFSIVGGHGSSQGDLPIYIKTVFEDSCKSVLKRGDQILAVDGVRLEGLTHQQTVLILKNSGDTVTLTILSSS